MAGNGPHPCGPCRYACTGQPVPYTKGSLLEVRVTRPPTTPHRRLPTRGARDGRRHSHSARTGHRPCWSSPLHAADRCIAAWKCIGSRRPLQSFHPHSAASLFSQRYKKARLMQTVTSLAYSHRTSPLHDTRNQPACLVS